MLMQILNQFELDQNVNWALRPELKIDVPDLMSLPSPPQSECMLLHLLRNQRRVLIICDTHKTESILPVST